MSKFLTGEDLSKEVYNIIWDAESTLLIVSPYIKLGKYFKELFDHHLHNHKLHLILVFGKNEKDVKKSMSQVDLDYFQQFPNISIVYVPNLHAKYYGNEKKGVITSINLYDYSFKNNIEFGVFTEQKLISKFTSSADVEAWNECLEMAHTNEVVYVKRPAYRSKKGFISFGKEYVKSEVLFDSTDKFYGSGKSSLDSDKRLDDFQDEIDLDQAHDIRPARVWEEEKKESVKAPSKRKASPIKTTDNDSKIGFCIRTGEEIEFNPERPMSLDAFKKWNQFQDVNYGEAYCHYSGDQSFGETSFARPILRKYWKKAMSS